jgi:hypothetical protein
MNIDPKTNPPERTFKHIAQELRAEILGLDKVLLSMRKETQQIDPTWNRAIDIHEMLANLELAHRHLEDARMRMGQFLQPFDGGTSVYDK